MPVTTIPSNSTINHSLKSLYSRENPALAPTPVTPWVWDLTSENLSTSRPCSPLTDMSISLFCSSRSSASEYFQEASAFPELPGRVKCRTLSKDTCQSTDCHSVPGAEALPQAGGVQEM